MERRIFETHERMRSDLPVLFSYQRSYPQSSNIFGVGNWHKNLEVLYFYEGEGLVNCNGTVHPVSPGCMIVVNTNELHSFLSREGMEYYCLIIAESFLSDNGIPIEQINFRSLVRDNFASGLFLKIKQEYEQSQTHHKAAIRANVLQLFVYLARNHSVPDRKYQKADENVKQAIGFINANASDGLSLERIAQEVNLNKSHLARIFKKSTGMTVISYLNMIRCENAKRLLIHKDISVNEVASLCGFESCSYFAKTFRKYMGCLPSDIRQKQDYHDF